MRKFWLILLALFFVLSTSASAAASVHKCCAMPECDITQCIDMGCAPALPAFAFDTQATGLPLLLSEVPAAPAEPSPPRLYQEVWTPPD
jgi:hypothetical protein